MPSVTLITCLHQRFPSLVLVMKHTLAPGITILAIAMVLMVALSLLVTNGMTASFDLSILSWFARHRSVVWDGYFIFITWAGSMTVLIPAGIVTGLILLKQKQISETAFLLCSLFAASTATWLLKEIIDRERPNAWPVLGDAVTGFTFPSGHATQITAFSLALFLVLRQIKPAWQIPVGIIASALTLSVLVSRSYLQAHYPTDVIGGVLMAVIIVSACWLLILRMKMKT